jgi:hypothetical protein
MMSTVFFVVPQLIVRFVNNEPKLDRTTIYLVFAFILPLIWIFLPKEVLTMREVNFIQHGVGGGVAVGFVAIYFIKNFRERFAIFNNILFQLLFVYALVSMLGVANELLEFLLDFSDIGIFSADRYDTWFDLLANSTGAFGVFICWAIGRKLF